MNETEWVDGRCHDGGAEFAANDIAACFTFLAASKKAGVALAFSAAAPRAELHGQQHRKKRGIQVMNFAYLWLMVKLGLAGSTANALCGGATLSCVGRNDGDLKSNESSRGGKRMAKRMAKPDVFARLNIAPIPS
jgi:hypothetical protein